MRHSKTSPSINYLKNIDYYSQMHKEGIKYSNGDEKNVQKN